MPQKRKTDDHPYLFPLLAKFNCLPLHTLVKQYEIKSQRILRTEGMLFYLASAYGADVFSVISFNLSKENCHIAIKTIILTFKNFSKV